MTSSDYWEELEKKIQYKFEDRSLLEQAFTHSSFAHEVSASRRDVVSDYEELEFLGDSILGFLISEYLYRTHLSLNEGELSKIRSYLVSARHLTALSRSLDLGKYLRLGHGEEKTGGRSKETILADLFESLVASIYLDGGWEPVRHFVFTQFGPALEKVTHDKLAFQDRKSLLQEMLHVRGLPQPSYRVVAETGPDHKKEFQVELYVDNRLLAKGRGRSKKEAQQNAAGEALEKLTGEGVTD